MESDQTNIKAIKLLRYLLSAVCILSGFLAGETVDRLIVGLPAWHYVDINAWAEYSRHADLGNGTFVYPLEAIGSFLLLIIASGILFKNKIVRKSVSQMVYLSTTFALIVLVLTFFAAPFMLSIKNLNDPASLQYAFEKFYYWSTFRGVVQILSFVVCVFASVNIRSDK